MAKTEELLLALLQQQKQTNELIARQMGVSDPSLAAPSVLPFTHDESGRLLQDWTQIVFDVMVNAGAQGNVTQVISQEYHFHCLYITGDTNNDPGTGPLSCRVSDSSSDSHMQHNLAFINWENFIGTQPAGGMATPNMPYTLFGFRRYSAGTTINWEFINPVGAANQTIQVVMHGVKVYVPYPKK